MPPSAENDKILDWLNSGTNKIANKYPNMKVITNKDTFGKAMNFAVSQDAEVFDFVPPTFELPSKEDEARFAKYQKDNPNATYIAKPNSGA